MYLKYLKFEADSIAQASVWRMKITELNGGHLCSFYYFLCNSELREGTYVQWI